MGGCGIVRKTRGEARDLRSGHELSAGFSVQKQSNMVVFCLRCTWDCLDRWIFTFFIGNFLLTVRMLVVRFRSAGTWREDLCFCLAGIWTFTRRRFFSFFVFILFKFLFVIPKVNY